VLFAERIGARENGKMLDEIRSFFEALREEPKPPWPEGIPAVDPATGEDLRAVWELHWRLMKECVDDLETKIVDLYDAGAETPAMIDLIDEVVAIIRQKDKSKDQRVLEIGQLMQRRNMPITRT
jgi:hypothetical protein